MTKAILSVFSYIEYFSVFLQVTQNAIYMYVHVYSKSHVIISSVDYKKVIRTVGFLNNPSMPES